MANAPASRAGDRCRVRVRWLEQPHGRLRLADVDQHRGLPGRRDRAGRRQLGLPRGRPDPVEPPPGLVVPGAVERLGPGQRGRLGQQLGQLGPGRSGQGVHRVSVSCSTWALDQFAGAGRAQLVVELRGPGSSCWRQS